MSKTEAPPGVNRAVLDVLAKELCKFATDDPQPALALAVLDACDTTPNPQAKFRQLLFNLRANARLRDEVAAGIILPEELVVMPKEKLATESLRQRDRQAGESAQQAASLSATALEIQRVKKTGGTKMEWFGGDEEEDEPATLASQSTTAGGTSPVPPGRGTSPTTQSLKRPLDEDTAPNPAVGGPVPPEQTTIDGVYVSKRLRSNEPEPTGHALVQQLTQARKKAVRVRSLTAGAKERAAAAARKALGAATAGGPKLPRENYKSVLRATVHRLIQQEGSDETAPEWPEHVVAQYVSAELVAVGYSNSTVEPGD